MMVNMWAAFAFRRFNRMRTLPRSYHQEPPAGVEPASTRWQRVIISRYNMAALRVVVIYGQWDRYFPMPGRDSDACYAQPRKNFFEAIFILSTSAPGENRTLMT
jgi:hypothetical protein